MKSKVILITGASSGMGREFVYAVDREFVLDEIWVIARRKEKLEEFGFILTPKDNKEVMKKISDQDGSRYVRKLINLVDRFIGNFKTNGYPVQQFDDWQVSANNVRTKLFLRICKECYLEYERYLNKNNAIDFSDMINKSAALLKESESVRSQIKFKYIIVDEYQDISRQRFDLVEALHANSAAKIIAVGDDWQSIYAFSGSDITLFTKFSEIMGYAELLSITKTYRNSQEVIDIAGNFIQKNSSQIKKHLQSPKTIDDPVIIYTYDSKLKERGASARSGAIYNLAKAVETAIEQIIAYDKETERKSSSILLLGRFGFDGKNLERSGLFEYKDFGSKVKCIKYPKLNITFMTAHASKGLGYDNVIVINGKNETYGFPSKIEDDPVLNYVIKRDNTIEAAEERRLFYVAMTRTKNRVYFVAPEENPALMNALAKFLAYGKGRDIEVFMPYSMHLKSLSEWYIQLLAESLGKKFDREGNVVNYGRTPIVAVGTTDMHAQTQQHQEGKLNKVVQFLEVAEPRENAIAKNSFPHIAFFKKYDGLSMHKALKAALDANEAALCSDNRYNARFIMPKINEYYLGQLMFFLMLSVAYEGELADVDAYDQPGVEIYKAFMKSKL